MLILIFKLIKLTVLTMNHLPSQLKKYEIDINTIVTDFQESIPQGGRFSGSRQEAYKILKIILDYINTRFLFTGDQFQHFSDQSETSGINTNFSNYRNLFVNLEEILTHIIRNTEAAGRVEYASERFATESAQPLTQLQDVCEILNNLHTRISSRISNMEEI